MFNGKVHYELTCSIAILVITRVYLLNKVIFHSYVEGNWLNDFLPTQQSTDLLQPAQTKLWHMQDTTPQSWNRFDQGSQFLSYDIDILESKVLQLSINFYT